MEYRIEVFDNYGRRIASFDEVPLLRATRTAPDEPNTIEGILPGPIDDLSPGYLVRVYVDGRLVCATPMVRVNPQWSDTRKLILDRFVHFHEVIAFEARAEALEENRRARVGFTNQRVDAMVESAINRTLGPIHYYVDHAAYPDGAVREFAKFDARKTAANELQVGGILSGQWVGGARIEKTNAVAKDGDTIAGLKVDGVDWPDLRLMLIDCEETSLNSHAISRHPEVAEWTDAQYDASGYKLQADRAKALLQSLIDTKGIDFIELNPHVDADGNFDDRVDAFGRYLGFAYGGGECFNAAMVEQSLADVYLFDDGKFHVPEMELKDYFSYAGQHADSIADAPATLGSFDIDNGIYEALTALAYAAGGYVWSLDDDYGVTFRAAERAERVLFFDPVEHRVTLGSDRSGLVNFLVIKGNPLSADLDEAYARGSSIDEFGLEVGFLDYFSLTLEEDAAKIAADLLDDIAYPEPSGEVAWLHGNASVEVGDLVEVRGAPVRRIDRAIDGEWGGRFTDRIVGRVRAVMHVFRGRLVETEVRLTSPLRSVSNPLSFIVRQQVPAGNLFQFRLDEETVGVDMGYHLD